MRNLIIEILKAISPDGFDEFDPDYDPQTFAEIPGEPLEIARIHAAHPAKIPPQFPALQIHPIPDWNFINAADRARAHARKLF